VNCYVTTNAYPFNNTSPNNAVTWIGGSTYYHPNATSDKDGRANTDAITDATDGAVKICEDLGTGWYLPAYEELVNMSAGTVTGYPPLNNLSGAGLLTMPNSSYRYWSSTEHYNNGGRCSGGSDLQRYVVHVSTGGFPYYGAKDGYYYVRCAWRP
jgi:hypothetical protein